MIVSVPHPIPYQGSKRQLANQLLRYFPANVERMYEVFAGSAAFTLAVAYQQKAYQFSINDVLKPLIELWDQILQNPERLAMDYATIWHTQLENERETYSSIRNQYNSEHKPVHLLYLLARCVKNAVRFNALGEFNQSADHRRRGVHPIRMHKHILATSRLLHGKTKTQSVDFEQAILEPQQNDFVYLDPPYFGTSKPKDKRYFQQLEHKRLFTALESLNQRCVPFMLSFDGCCGEKDYAQPMPRELGLKRVELSAGRSTQATLLGRTEFTKESLYLSPALQRKL
jgi:DNA adenine methylase